MKIVNIKGGWLPSRKRKLKLTGIILHSTAGKSAESSISWLRQLALWLKPASYHYIIKSDGLIIKCVPIERVAFHAGESVGWQGKWCNEYSAGIAFDCYDPDGEALTDAQIKAAKDLCAHLAGAYPNMNWISLHRIVSPGRKTDPATLTNRQYEEIARFAGLKRWKP